MEINEIVAGFAALTPVVAGVVEAVKRAGLSSRYAPLASVLVAVGLALAISPKGAGVVMVVVGGIVLGLSASGLYSGIKTVKG